MNMPEEAAIRSMIEDIADGVDVENAAMRAGLSVGDLYYLLELGGAAEDQLRATGKKGTKQQQAYRSLFISVRTARAEAFTEAQRAIMTAARAGDWKASAWWLERNAPQRFGPPEKQKAVEVSTVVAEIEG